jgi:glycosyltransferase involved in cell wall biosynthesis
MLLSRADVAPIPVTDSGHRHHVSVGVSEQNNVMRVLFLSNEHSDARSAYAHRLNKLRSELEKCGIRTAFVSLREQAVPRPVLAQPLSMPALLRVARDCNFIHAGGNAAYTASFLKRFTRARIIHDVHGDELAEAQLKFQARRDVVSAYWVAQAAITSSITYRVPDFYLVVSNPSRERLAREHRIAERRIGLVRNGVDTNELAFVPDGHRTKAFIVCYAGGFQQWQGISNLLAAFELLRNDSVQLKIIGFTETEAALRSQIVRRFGSNVQLVDRLPRHELAVQLLGAHAFVIPRNRHRALEVALPTKFAEYLAIGRPLIVCDVDETAHLVQQHHCGVVSSSNPEALAETIRFLSNQTDAELADMGRNARSLAEREFSWDLIGRHYRSLLNSWEPGNAR